MSHFRNHPEIFNQPFRLTTEDPEAVIQNFFSAYRLCEIRQHLWDLVETALTTENEIYSDSRSRNKLLWFYRQVEEMVEAIYQLKNSVN